MAKNFVQGGEVLALASPYDRLSGQGALIGSIFGVALIDAANGVIGEFMTEGVFDLTKTNAQAWTVGQRIYWDDANKRCDSSPVVGQLIGRATQVAANPSATGRVKLDESAPGFAEGPQPAIASLVDNGGGAAADGTIGAITAVANAGSADVGPVKDAIKELSTEVNAILVALRAAGILLP